MKDSQQMSVDISSQNDMALKALPPVSLKDSNIYPVDSMVNDDLGEENFRLHLSEDEDEERSPIKDSSTAQESEDDILNKFDTPETEGVTTNGCLESDELEESLLNDVSDKENESVVTNGECANEEAVNSDSDLRNTKGDSVISDNEETTKTSTQENEKTQDEERAKDIAEAKEKVNADLLNNQIMDTEHLLQIVDQQDSEEMNENSNSGENTPEKDDSDAAEMETNDNETDKNDDEDDNQELKNGDDGVDIDEETSYRNDFDSELDKEYEKIINEKESEVSSDTPEKEKSDEDEAVPEKTDEDEPARDNNETESKKSDEAHEGMDTEAHEDMDTEAREDMDSNVPTDIEATTDIDGSTAMDVTTDNDTSTVIDATTVVDDTTNIDTTAASDATTLVDTAKPTDDTAVIDTTTSIDATTVTKTATGTETTADIETTTDIEITPDTDVTTDKDVLTSKDATLDPEVLDNNANEKLDDKVNRTEAETNSMDAKSLTDSVSTNKRSLSESDLTNDSKRLRLDEEITNEEQSEGKKDDKSEESDKAKPVVALNAISEYMQKKTLKKLTRQDLEQICLLKMCEAICHKSEIGELRHQLGVQEQMIDMWRKEAAQLTKQARDLEIVNKRLLHEVRLKNDRDKPLIPVKITRSVGLQVRSDNNVMNNVVGQKRRFTRPQPTTATTPTKSTPTTPTLSKPNPIPSKQPNRYTQSKPSTPTSVNKTIPNKSVPSPISKPLTPIKPKTIATKSPSSLLSKALQNSTVQAINASSGNTSTNNSVTPPLASISSTSTTTTTSVTSKLNASPKPTKATSDSKTFIDLTDEDEKKPSSTSSPSSTPVNGNTTPGVRIVSTPVKNTTVASSPGVVNPPRIMYVYNNQLHQGLLATDSSKIGTQKLMLKLNSNVIGQANGVLTAVSNGSTIAVSNAAIRTNQQVQPVRLSTPVTPVRTSPAVKTVVKHPAPLPPPPISQMGLAARKPIPPKPHLSIRRSSGGIVLSWKMPYNLDNYEAIASYQLYAYQETTSPPSSDMWRKVGDVKALALPMACTLTQFADGNKYHFAVRAVDVQKRMGPFSDPEQILL